MIPVLGPYGNDVGVISPQSPYYPNPKEKPSCYIKARCGTCPYNNDCGNSNKKDGIT